MKKIFLSFIVLFLGASNLFAQTSSIQGTYNSVLIHEAENEEETEYHQFATITLRTVNTGQELNISATVKMIYGDWDSNEYLTYEYPEVPLNLLTRQISISDPNNDVSFIGVLRDNQIEGEWYASSVGRIGNFEATKERLPEIPEESFLVKNISGFYRGQLTNTHPESNLPERVTISLVTTQVANEEGQMRILISGSARFYLGGFGSNEYIEDNLSDVQFNFYTRYLTIKTEEYGITYKGTLDQGGFFDADVYADGLGRVGYADLELIE